MAARIEMEPGWEEQVLAAVDDMFMSSLGPQITASAKAYCPVFGGENSTASEESLAGPDAQPGALRDSVKFEVTRHELVVSATGSEERQYAAYVELGHRVVAWGHDTGTAKGPQPFLRPALYQERAL
jgi:hypothetical protein